MIIINGETIEVLKFDLEKYQKSRCLYALHISLEFSWQNFLFFKPWGKLDMYCNSAFDSYYSTSEEENEKKISNSFFNFLMEGWLKLFLRVCVFLPVYCPHTSSYKAGRESYVFDILLS